jgi:hypothetical protein
MRYILGLILLVAVASAQPAFIESGGQVVMEAENFTASATGTGAASGKTWNAVTVTGSSGGARQALTNTGVNTADTLVGARLDYRVKFATTGTYFIWVRLQGATANDNAIHVGLNNSAATLGSAGMSTGTTFNSWVWKKVKENNATVSVNVTTAGYATVNLWMREDGVVVDKIVLTRVPRSRRPAPVLRKAPWKTSRLRQRQPRSRPLRSPPARSASVGRLRPTMSR